MYLLGIAIDGGKYAVVNSEISKSGRIVKLKALSAVQNKAVLKFYIKKKNTFVHVKTERLNGLYRKANNAAEITLTIKYSFFKWIIEISNPGIESYTVKFSAVNRLKYLLTAAVPAVVSVVLILGFKPAGFINELFFSGKPLSEDVSADPDSGQHTVNPLLNEENNASDSSSGITQSSGESVQTAPAQEKSAEKIEKTEKKVFYASVYFQPDCFRLNAAAENTLDQLAENVNSFLKSFQADSENTTGSVEIVLTSEGHCAKYGTESGRMKLSEKRASATAEYIADLLPEKIRIIIKGLGSSRPATVNPDKQNLNRRAEITVTVQL
jgi:outer membrane protein OmpA-like peptidoglycan-associated protein